MNQIIHRIVFILALLMSLALVVATVTQTLVYKRWDEAFARQQEAQAELASTQRVYSFDTQFLHRLGVDSLRDPAIAGLLGRHNLKVNVSTSAPGDDATPGDTLKVSAATPSPPDKITAVPADQLPTPTPASGPVPTPFMSRAFALPTPSPVNPLTPSTTPTPTPFMSRAFVPPTPKP